MIASDQLHMKHADLSFRTSHLWNRTLHLCLIIQKKKADINVPIANLYKTIFVFLTPNTKDILENINIENRLLGLILSKAGKIWHSLLIWYKQYTNKWTWVFNLIQILNG